VTNEKKYREWLITIINPVDFGFSNERVREAMLSLSPIYWTALNDCVKYVQAPHTSIYLVLARPIIKDKLRDHFPNAQVESADAPDHHHSSDLIRIIRGAIYDEVENRVLGGASDEEILIDYPHYLHRLDGIRNAIEKFYFL